MQVFHFDDDCVAAPILVSEHQAASEQKRARAWAMAFQIKKQKDEAPAFQKQVELDEQYTQQHPLQAARNKVAHTMAQRNVNGAIKLKQTDSLALVQQSI